MKLAIISVVLGLGLVVLTPSAQAQKPPCCTITKIDTRLGVVSAVVKQSGESFEFKVADANLLKSLKVGQGIYANFTAHQVSLDGKTACCSIVSGTTAAPAPAGGAPAHPPLPPANAGTRPAQQPSGAKPGAKPGAAGAGLAVMQGTKPNPFVIPPVSYGAPQNASSAGPDTGNLPGRRGSVNANVVRLHGMGGIKSAAGIPQGARDFLLMHARTLPPGEVDNYVVNVQLAETWFKTHPEPESVKKAAAKGDGHTGCDVVSVHCAEEAGKHAEDEVARQSQLLLRAAQDEWKHITGEVGHDWNMAESCFADHTLQLPNVPVKFQVSPSFPLSFEKDGTTSNQYGSASGSIKGTVTFGVPIQSDFSATVDMFYIPCLPFAVRPKSIGANGNLGVGSLFSANATATGKFNQMFTIPPQGGPHFPIETIPIIIGDVPVAELDISVYVDGRILVDGEGTITGDVGVKTMQDTTFDFSCSGSACDLQARSVPEPVVTTESVKIDGRIHVKPEVYAALQLDFDVDLLTARAGPQPYLLGEIYGCAAASATQSAGTTTSSQQSYALTSDLDWGVELRAEALVAEKKVAEKEWKLLQRHLYFRDLAHSTALVPGLSGTPQVALGQPATFAVKMPDCYPYKDQIEYQVKWTGGATTSAGAASPSVQSGTIQKGSVAGNGGSSVSGQPFSCNLQAGQGVCWGDPLHNGLLHLTWPSAGSFNVAVRSVRDKHGRVFDPPPSEAQLGITVQ